jgi:hypothetical protein
MSPASQFCTGRYESEHHDNKDNIVTVRKNINSAPLKHALGKVNDKKSLAHVFSGGYWGSGLQFHAGSLLLKLKDYRKNRIYFPHPIIEPFIIKQVTEPIIETDHESDSDLEEKQTKDPTVSIIRKIQQHYE